MANFLADLQSFLPVPPGTFSDPPPKKDEGSERNISSFFCLTISAAWAKLFECHTYGEER
eukprot:768177-Hanusia_phi.AAC.1